MALEIGNLLGAAAHLTTVVAKGKSLKSFLQTFNQFGIQVSNNFEVNLAGLEDITFYAQTVQFNGLSQKFDDLWYNGRSVPVPNYIDYEHEGSMTLFNDAQGYLYAAISNFLLSNSAAMLANGVVMTIKCLTGDPNYKGSLITLNNVRINKIDGLSFEYEGGGPSKITIGFNYLDFTFTPGALGKAAGIVGAVEKLIS